MNPTAFPRYSAPPSLEAVLQRAQMPEATPLGGGTVLYPLLQRSEVETEEVIDLFGLPGLNTITATETTVRIGAMTTYADILNSPDPSIPTLLRAAAGAVTGGPQLRNQGTVGGSACYANPASDVPSVLVALHAQLHLSSSERGDRHVAAAEFFVGPFATSCEDDEVLVNIVLPRDGDNESWGRYKLKTSEGSWPIGVAGACVRSNPTGSGGSVTVTLGALTATPVELAPLQLSDCSTLSDTERSQLQDLISEADPQWWSDELADANYRSRVAGPVAARAVSAAITQRTSNV